MKKPPLLLFSFVIIYLVFLYAPIMLLPIFAFNDSSIIAFLYPALRSIGLLA